MAFIEPDILMAEEEFRLIRDYIYNHCGLSFDISSKFLLEKRLSNRVKLHQLKNFKEYYRFLRYDPKSSEELSAIIDILTTNETYFFRESCQLKAFSEEILSEIKNRKENNTKERNLCIWSAGCSTGEEPYTIAMLILETGQFKDWNIEIFGNDISQRVLQVARKGVYTQSSFRSTHKNFIDKYFEPFDGKYKIKDEVKNMVRFGYLNLIERNKMSLLRSMDVIFCRNVLIYFDVESKKKVIRNFYDKLEDGGYLLLGHAESMMNISTAYTLQHLKNDMVYRKPFKEIRNAEFLTVSR
ncbi:MAG: chemotaxis protein CheR [Deltaproteobacteria bacterium RIFCSPLOWO2_12_FULL_43_16]|nr:MAG: chemotaxis protein CheR [Deltaproteobacteria bacterium GWA2_43_19]OGQ12437.1 MAG: chemotaxis protein CheR [Deltaproteobacteria bacterium RIFCSPHIGHO2_02_FULL_43_33]OGQ59410.1 MAG: chemotaxis protein CheR [Deltaproteobacteria bacterium RIFCSPLOWO2_12_FULL_43_16]HBR17831.1 chemotaxis protein CheR [Deltaproteobacteria bacterium]